MDKNSESMMQTNPSEHTKISSRTIVVVLAVAMLVAILHMIPFWHAQSQTAPGYIFTGNISNSPDMMQYRVWTRQSLESGILVEDKFTTEPNEPHLLVIFYYTIGKIAELFNVAPEFVYAYIGSVFAFLFVLVLFVFVRKFFSKTDQLWWVFLVTLFGGGLGAYIRILSDMNFVRNNFLLRTTLVEGYWSWPSLFEAYRGNYIVISLFDTHFIFMWLVATLSVFFLYLTVQKFSWLRLSITALFFILTTLVHVYEGVTLAAILVMITALMWRRKLASRSLYLTSAILLASIIFGVVYFYLLYQSSGLEPPDWRGRNVLFSILLISYPLAWLVIFPGIARFWQDAGLKETFLIGWALGCLALTLSGPYFPYPDRGTMTLQIPLTIIAGLIYFRHFKKVTWLAAVVIVAVAGMTPAWAIQKYWENSSFNSGFPSMWLSEGHEEIIDRLKSVADENDILITDMSKVDWEVDPLWLAPDYPGKFYSAHFFLTVDFDDKRQELIEFYNPLTKMDDQIAFLNEKQVRFVFVDAAQDPDRFEQIPGLKLIVQNSVGAIYEYDQALSN